MTGPRGCPRRALPAADAARATRAICGAICGAAAVAVVALVVGAGMSCGDDQPQRSDAAGAADASSPADGQAKTDGGVVDLTRGEGTATDGRRPDHGGDGPSVGGDCIPNGPVLEVGPGQAFATIGAALQSVGGMPATVRVADGLYDESLTLTNGGSSADARLLLCAAHSRGATIRASGRVLRIRAPWITVQGFVIDGGWGDSVVVGADQGADHLILRDLEVKNSTRDGIDVGDCDDVLIDGCTVHHMLAGSTTDQQDAHCVVGTAFDGLTIRGSELYYCSGDCVQVGTGDRAPWNGLVIEASRLWTGPLPADAAGFKQGEVPGENALDTKAQEHPAPWRGSFVLRDSEFFGFDPASAYIDNRAALNIKNQVTGVVERCTVHDSEVGLRVRGAGTYGGVEGLAVVNTVFYRNQFHVRVEDDALDLSWLHNTFGRLIDASNTPLAPAAAAHLSNTFFGGGGGDEGAGWQTDNNLYLAGARPERSTGSGDRFVDDTSVWLDFARDDYHLARQLDAATGVGVNVDRDGHPRSPSSPDVGAYEYETAF